MSWQYIVGAVGVGALSLAAAAYWYQDFLLYFPSMPPGARSHFENPASYRLQGAVEEIMLRAEDDAALHLMVMVQGAEGGVVDVAEPLSAPTVVFFHGNAGNLSHRLAFFSILYRKLKCNVVGVEYRGFGRSTGSPCEKALQKDAVRVFDFLLSRTDFVNPKRIVAFGRSLGGAVALHLCRDLKRSALPNESSQVPNESSRAAESSRAQLAAVVAENTFTSVLDMVPHVMPLLSRLPPALITNKWNNKEVIQEITDTPVLLIRGEQDELVPPFMSDALYEAAQRNNPHAQIMSFPGGHHMDTWLESGYAKRVREYFESLGLYERVDE